MCILLVDINKILFSSCHEKLPGFYWDPCDKLKNLYVSAEACLKVVYYCSKSVLICFRL